MLSLWDRLPAMANGPQSDRVDLLRRGARQFDISAAIEAGQLVILAEAEDDQPLPFPLDVDGKRVPGKGTIFYQIVLPLSREKPKPPTTGPTAINTTANPHSAIRSPKSRIQSVALEHSSWRP